MSGNAPSVQLHDQFNQCQPDAEPAETPASLLTALMIQIKDPGEQIGRDPDTIISEFQNHRVPRTCYLQMDVATGLRVAGRIGKEVVNDLLQPQRISVHIHRLIRKGYGEKMPSIDEQPGRGFGTGRDDEPDINHLLAERESAFPAAAQIQHILDDAGQVLNLPSNQPAHLPVGRCIVGHLIGTLHGELNCRERLT